MNPFVNNSNTKMLANCLCNAYVCVVRKNWIHGQDYTSNNNTIVFNVFWASVLTQHTWILDDFYLFARFRSLLSSTTELYSTITAILRKFMVLSIAATTYIPHCSVSICFLVKLERGQININYLLPNNNNYNNYCCNSRLFVVFFYLVYCFRWGQSFALSNSTTKNVDRK